MRTTVVLGQVGVGESNARTCLGWFEREPSEKVSEVTPVAIPNILGLLGIATNVGLGLFSPSSRSNHPKQVRALDSTTPTCLRMTVVRISSNTSAPQPASRLARGTEHRTRIWSRWMILGSGRAVRPLHHPTCVPRLFRPCKAVTGVTSTYILS